MKLLLADDQTKVRSALRLLLEQQTDVEIMGEAVDSRGVLDWIRVACPDLILFDWELPGLQGLQLVRAVHGLCPAVQLIAMSGRPESRAAALAAGVDVFVSKGEPPEKLLCGIEQCQAGAEHPPGAAGGQQHP
jgi:DNA-binding NarL/FixJ family response regulator